jgi:hypothetical protein
MFITVFSVDKKFFIQVKVKTFQINKILSYIVITIVIFSLNENVYDNIIYLFT